MSIGTNETSGQDNGFRSGVPIDYPINRVDQIREIVVHQEGVTPEVVYETRLEKPQGEYQYLICRGEYQHKSAGDYTDTYVTNRGGVTHKRFLLTPEKALRRILGFGEQHGIDEDELIGELSAEEWFKSSFSKIVREDSATRLKKGINCLSQTTTDGEREYFNRVLSLGRKRKISQELDPHHDAIDAQCCYRVAYELAQKYEELNYVEGFAINKYGSMPRFHAWNELNGKVLDYTWEWTGSVPDEDAVYYGVKVDLSDVREAKRRRGYCARVLIEDYNTTIWKQIGDNV